MTDQRVMYIVKYPYIDFIGFYSDLFTRGDLRWALLTVRWFMTGRPNPEGSR